MAASLREVAAKAGVSVRTVSNVVSGSAPVAAATRERVQQVLDELQYRPNFAARQLRGGRTGLVGLVVPELSSPYFAELAGLFVDAALERSWTLLIDQSGGTAEGERRLLEGSGRRVLDGLVLSPWALPPEDLTRYAGEHPLVVLGERDPHGVADHVSVDNVAAAHVVTTHLLATGRTRIAAVGVQPHLANATAAQRLLGHRQALADAGRTPDPALEVAVSTLHRAEGARAVRELLDAPHPPDAVFCFSDQLALGALRAARERGVRVPEDLALAGFDDIEDGRYATPSLTTVAPDKQQIAARALQCLADRLAGRGSAVAQRVVVPHRLVVRESTGRATAGPAPR
ncbi:LacI family DNA-binding transcriptional regulator [Kineococcus rubinsiae]|uniref:LacI family DNA-binding transcriptional regulator n=1 Tax=Kineococcus rubinsiae TaxID=2609562 RepID=UPI001430C157|nr:LacI family DNA-binding transcriptional regulator [Kineococcus rubinsiae]NIZ93008.1 LacI family transcriptional regulator [Kineococcus rubinsiae]